MVPQCDVVTINAPLHPETEHLFDDAMFARMKRGTYLVNTARGKICDRDAVVRALESGQLAGYAGDVWYPQPPPADHPWRTMPHEGMTPHISGTSLSAQASYAAGTREILECFLGGRPDPRRVPHRGRRPPGRHRGPLLLGGGRAPHALAVDGRPQLGQAVAVERVPDPLAPPVAVDQSGLAEDLEVMGDGGLALAEGVDEVADADLARGGAASMLSTRRRTGSASAVNPWASSSASTPSRGAESTEGQHSTTGAGRLDGGAPGGHGPASSH